MGEENEGAALWWPAEKHQTLSIMPPIDGFPLRRLLFLHSQPEDIEFCHESLFLFPVKSDLQALLFSC